MMKHKYYIKPVQKIHSFFCKLQLTVAYPEVNLGILRARSVSVGKSTGGL